MTPEPLSDAQCIDRFVRPSGVLLTERADVLARVYAGVMASGVGYNDSRVSLAREATIGFVRLINGEW